MKNLPKIQQALCLLLFLSFFLMACTAHKMPTSNYPAQISIENTKWSGVDSDGDFCEYIFHQGGQLEYRTNTSRRDTIRYKDPENVWSQNGSTIILLKGNTSVQVGRLKGNVIQGNAWNKHGRTWVWRVEKH
ncbi:MAG: hypothetical protein AB8E82_04735 [Aureispira sp.]